MTSDRASAVSIRSHFERFPATVKGAFVVRGEDADPHQVSITGARAVGAGGGQARVVELAPVILDVPPHTDVFVPFELPVADLEPGWYGLECSAEVDGTPAEFPPTRRFVVSWPRAAVRRGTVPVGATLAAGSRSLGVDRLECGADSIKLHVTATPPEPPRVRLSADGRGLPVIDVTMDEETGAGIVSAYPLLRATGVLSIALGSGRGPSIDVPLP